MDRVKNGIYKDCIGNIVEITDNNQPLFVTKIIANKYFSKKYIVICENGIQIEIPHDSLTESEYIQSWQSKNKLRNIPCDILISEFGRVGIPKNSNYNLDVKSYCKQMTGGGCPALIMDYNKDTYSCKYKKIKKSDYDEIVSFSKTCR